MIKWYSAGLGSAFAVFYKEVSLGLNEYNWSCADKFYNCCVGTVGVGPLTAGTQYYIMIKKIHNLYCGGSYEWFDNLSVRFDCPANCYIPLMPYDVYNSLTTTSIRILAS